MHFEKEEAFFTHCVLYIPETKDAEHPEPKAASRRRMVSCWQMPTRTKTGPLPTRTKTCLRVVGPMVD